MVGNWHFDVLTLLPMPSQPVVVGLSIYYKFFMFFSFLLPLFGFFFLLLYVDLLPEFHPVNGLFNLFPLGVW